MSPPSRRKALTGAAAAAAVSLLAPARVRAAVETSGRLNIKEHPGGLMEAIATRQPLYAPPGAYELPAGITLTQPLDLLGDAAQRPTFTWRGDDAFIAGAAPIRFQNCRFTGGDGYLVNMNETAVEVPYIGVIDCSFENSGGVIGWPTIHPQPGGKLRQLEVRRVSAKNVRRGIMVQGGHGPLRRRGLRVRRLYGVRSAGRTGGPRIARASGRDGGRHGPPGEDHQRDAKAR